MGKTLSARKKDYLQITLGEKEAHKSHISQKKLGNIYLQETFCSFAKKGEKEANKSHISKKLYLQEKNYLQITLGEKEAHQSHTNKNISAKLLSARQNHV